MPSSPPSDAEHGNRVPVLLQALDGSLDPSTLIDLVHQLEVRGLLDKSERLAKCGLVGRPERSDFLAMVGFNAFNRGDFETAVRLLSRASCLSPKNAEIAFNLLLAYEAAGDHRRADIWAERLRTNLPLDHPLIKRIAGYLLRNGRREKAWTLLFQRLRRQGRMVAENALPAALTTHGQLVIDMEDFLGEAIESAALLRRAGVKTGKNLILKCTQRLHRLFARTFPDAVLTDTYDGSAPVIGYEALAGLLTETEREAGPDPTLNFDNERSREIAAALQAKFPGKILVGLAWRSAPRRHGDDRTHNAERRISEIRYQEGGSFHPAQSLWRKIAPLKQFAPLFEAEDIQLISAQNDLWEEELTFITEDLGIDLYQPDVDFSGDLDDVAAFLGALDALVGVPCTHAHLAGANGLKSFVMMPEAPPSQSNWPMHDTGWLYPDLHLLYKDRETGKTHYAGDWQPVMRADVLPLLRQRQTTSKQST